MNGGLKIPSHLLFCIEYKSPDAYSFLELFSSQDALLDTVRLLKLKNVVQGGCLIGTAHLFFSKISSYTPIIFFYLQR